MKKLLTLSIVVLLFCLSVFAQEQNSECPNIEFIEPDSVTYTGELLIFSISEKSIVELKNAEFKWSIDKGKIIKGQRTAKIEINTDSVENTVVTANLEISNLPPNCKNLFSAQTIVALRTGDIFPSDQYENLHLKDELARLDAFLVELINTPDLQGYVVISFKDKKTRRKEENRVRKLIKHLKYRKFPTERITFLFDKNSDRDETVLWRFPKNLEFTICENCEIVKISKEKSLTL